MTATGKHYNRPEHADKVLAIPGVSPRLSAERSLQGYAYPEHGNLHNPTPEYRWLLRVDGIIVDHFRLQRECFAAARSDGAAYLKEIDARKA